MRACACVRVCVLDNLFKPRERSISGREMQLRSRRWVRLMSLSVLPPLFLPSPSLIHHATLSHLPPTARSVGKHTIVIRTSPPHYCGGGGGFRGWLLYKCPWQQIWSSVSEPYLLLFPFALSGKTHLIRWRLPIVHFFFLLPPTLAKATLSDLEDLLANWLELLDWKKEPVWGLFIGWSRFLLAEVSSDKKKTTLPLRCQCVGTAQPWLQIFMQSSPPPPTSSFSVRVTPP